VKRALIITYFFPPANSVASPRVNAFAENFHKHGIYPVIVTRHWSGNENEWADYLQPDNSPLSKKIEENYTVYRFPQSINTKRNKLAANSKIFSKIYHLVNPLFGYFSTEVNAYRGLRNNLDEHLKENKYDFIIVSAPPFNSVRLGYELSLKYGLPLVLDLRDIWQGLIGGEKTKLSAREKYFLFFNKRYAKKWFSKAALLATVSQPLANEVFDAVGKRPVVITNGYEEKLFSKLIRTDSNRSFNFTVVGTLYPVQDISIVINGLKKIAYDCDIKNIKLNFIGVDAIKNVGNVIRKELKEYNMLLTGKIKREEALQFLADAHILFYAGWKGYKGIYSTKIFEYLGARKNILIAPGDDDVLDALIIQTRAGKIANSVDEFVMMFLQLYKEWCETGDICYEGIAHEIEKFSREKQTEKFAQEILNAIS
jgi:hypothetical protein